MSKVKDSEVGDVMETQEVEKIDECINLSSQEEEIDNPQIDHDFKFTLSASLAIIIAQSRSKWESTADSC
jgi:hypothetical protein